MNDLRFAFRQLAKTPSFTIIAVLTLVVGIGSATVVFSTVNSLLLKPLPHISKADEERLLYVAETNRSRGQHDIGWNYADFRDVQARATTLAGIWVHPIARLSSPAATNPSVSSALRSRGMRSDRWACNPRSAAISFLPMPN